MPRFKYLIIGGGMAAAAAASGIREIDGNGSIGIIGAELDPPYDRPPLSKGLWKGDSLDGVWRDMDSAGAELMLGSPAVFLDLRAKEVTTHAGDVHSFDRLLLATGGSPRTLPFSGDRIIYFRTMSDYRRLRELAEKGDRFAVIGGGFIGSEISAALAMNGKQVEMIFRGKTIGARVFPSDLGQFLNGYYGDKGVEISSETTIADIAADDEGVVVELADGRRRHVDGVVVGIGIRPNIELARQAGLTIENGIRVDRFLRTSHPDVYAAGDVAAFHSSVLHKVIRVEHEDNATTMGGVAGKNMAGRACPYDHLSSFYSDLFDLGYEAVGELSAALRTVADWRVPFEKGIVYYLADDRVRGVLLWNVWDRVQAARELIAQSSPVTANELRDRIAA